MIRPTSEGIKRLLETTELRCFKADLIIERALSWNCGNLWVSEMWRKHVRLTESFCWQLTGERTSWIISNQILPIQLLPTDRTASGSQSECEVQLTWWSQVTKQILRSTAKRNLGLVQINHVSLNVCDDGKLKNSQNKTNWQYKVRNNYVLCKSTELEFGKHSWAIRCSKLIIIKLFCIDCKKRFYKDLGNYYQNAWEEYFVNLGLG